MAEIVIDPSQFRQLSAPLNPPLIASVLIKAGQLVALNANRELYLAFSAGNPEDAVVYGMATHNAQAQTELLTIPPLNVIVEVGPAAGGSVDFVGRAFFLSGNPGGMLQETDFPQFSNFYRTVCGVGLSSNRFLFNTSVSGELVTRT